MLNKRQITAKFNQRLKELDKLQAKTMGELERIRDNAHDKIDDEFDFAQNDVFDIVNDLEDEIHEELYDLMDILEQKKGKK